MTFSCVPPWRAVPGSTRGATLAACIALTACSHLPEEPRVPSPLASTSAERLGTGAALGREPAATRITTLPAQEIATRGVVADATPARAPDGTPAVLNLEQVPLGTFATVAFAEVLKRNVQVDAQVLARRDLVTFRSGEGQTASQLETAARMVLKSFGVAVLDAGGLVRIVPDNANVGLLPEIRRGAALPDTPLPLRPIFHLVELQAVRQVEVANWLRTLFGERIKAQEDAGRNALLISGTPDNVRAALEAVAVLDQPLMSARSSLSISPVYWSADDLARRLAEVLSAQGYAVHPVGQPITPGAVRFPVILLPVAPLNAVFVFVANDALAQHVRKWVETLDKPNERGIGRNFFTYGVKHKDAETLAQTLERLLSGARPPQGNAPAGQPSGSAPSATRATSVVVDKSTNTLIFQANPEEFGQINILLQTLDRPAKAALIEVTVAEVAIDDKNQFGVEWLLRGNDSQGGSWTAGTAGGISLGSSGFNFRLLNNAGQVKAALNALASTNRATILSSPRVMARNGESATIQVGQEVPIITSQQATGSNVISGGGAGTSLTPQVLQTVQYRSTGVILKVKPVIHSGDQVDLDVTQEVSEAQSTDTGVNVSPTFSTRKVDTKLTLRHGATILLGGLISSTSTRGSGGIPGLKDVPVLGPLFGKQNVDGARRELIVLITPYIINDSHEAEAITEAFRNMIGPWTRPVNDDATPASPAPAGQGVPRR